MHKLHFLLCIVVVRYCSITHILQGYNEISIISHTLVGNRIVDHSDVVGASPLGAAPTTSSFSTQHQHGFNGLGRQLQDETRNI